MVVNVLSFCFTMLSFDPVTKVMNMYPFLVTYSSPHNSIRKTSFIISRKSPEEKLLQAS